MGTKSHHLPSNASQLAIVHVNTGGKTFYSLGTLVGLAGNGTLGPVLPAQLFLVAYFRVKELGGVEAGENSGPEGVSSGL